MPALWNPQQEVPPNGGNSTGQAFLRAGKNRFKTSEKRFCQNRLLKCVFTPNMPPGMLKRQDSKGICYDTLPDHVHYLIQGILYYMNYLILIKILVWCCKILCSYPCIERARLQLWVNRIFRWQRWLAQSSKRVPRDVTEVLGLPSHKHTRPIQMPQQLRRTHEFSTVRRPRQIQR